MTEIRLQKNDRVVNTSEIKGGIRRSEIQDELQLAIFDALNSTKSATGATDEMLDANEIKAFVDRLIAESGDDFQLGKRDINKILKALNLKDVKGLNKEKVFEFVEKLLAASSDVDTSTVTQDEFGNDVITTVYDNGMTERLNSDGTTEHEITDENGVTTTDYLNQDKNITRTVVVTDENNIDETIYTDSNGNVILDDDGNEVVTTYKAVRDGVEVLNESMEYVVDEQGNIVLDEEGKPIPLKKVTVDNQTDIETTTTINFNSGLAQDATVERGASVSTYLYDEQGQNPILDNTVEDLGNGLTRITNIEYNENGQTETIEEPGKTTVRTIQAFNTADGQQLLLPTEEIITEETRVATNKYNYTEQGATRTETIVDNDNSNNQTRNDYVLANGTDSDGNAIQRWAKLQQTKVVNGKTYQIQYDGNGNTPIVVQWDESPATIAKKFGCTVEELFEANPEAVKGQGNRKWFDVGAQIVVPREIEADNKNLHGRLSSEQAAAQYERDHFLRKDCNLKNYKRAGETFEYNGETYTVLGTENERERLVVQDEEGHIITASWDNQILTKEYVQWTRYYDRNIGNESMRRTVAGQDRSCVVVENPDREDGKRDDLGREFAVTYNGVVGTLSCDKDPDLHNGTRYICSDNYLLVDDHYRANGGNAGTVTGGENVTYIKDANGQVWYYDESTNVLMTGTQRQTFIDAEITAIGNTVYNAADGAGTDEDALKKGVGQIYSNELYNGISTWIENKNADYAKDVNATGLEELILDEETHGNARQYWRTLINNGAMTDEQVGTTVARELDHEMHGGFGITYQSDLQEVGALVQTREQRVATENAMKGIITDLEVDEQDSYVRAALLDDGFDIREVNVFEANGWLNSYDENNEEDYQHLTYLTNNLVFESETDDSEAIKAGLEVAGSGKKLKTYFYTKAGEVNTERGYTERITDQNSGEVFLSNLTVDDNEVDIDDYSAYSNILHRTGIPADEKARILLLDAKQDNKQIVNIFKSNEPDVYAAVVEQLQKESIHDCSTISDLYQKAYNQAKGAEQYQIKAGAIISGEVEFTDAEIEEFCIDLMHKIDQERGMGKTTGVSASRSNNADFMTGQLEAILSTRPGLAVKIRPQVEEGTFEYSYQHTYGDVKDGTTQNYTEYTKDTYLKMIDNTVQIVNDEVYYDENGNIITDTNLITELQTAYDQALQGLRDEVARLEREYRKQVGDEGFISGCANGLATYSGLGTDRDDVETRYFEAKTVLKNLEAAAKGQLRDVNGNVISASDYAKQIAGLDDELSQTNTDYQTSQGLWKMAPIIVPVAAVTITAGAVASVFSGGTLVPVAVSGVAAGLSTFGVNALEIETSSTGDTAEAWENNFKESGVAAGSTWGGGAIGKAVSGLSTGLKYSSMVAGDLAMNMGSEAFLTDGKITLQGQLLGGTLSVIGNTFGLRSTRKPNINTEPPRSRTALDVATADGSAPIGGKFSDANFENVRRQTADEVAQGVTPQRHAQLIDEAGNLKGSGSRSQGREIQHIVEDGTGVYHGKKGEIDLNTETDIAALKNFRREVASWDNTTRPKKDVLARIDKRIAALEADPVAAGGRSEVLDEVNANLRKRTDAWLDPQKNQRLGDAHMPDLEARIARANADELDDIVRGIEARRLNGTKQDLVDRLNHAVNQRRIELRPDIDMDGFNGIISNRKQAGKGLSEIETQDIVRLLQNCSDDEFKQIETAILSSNKNIRRNKQIQQAIQTRKQTPRVQDILDDNGQKIGTTEFTRDANGNATKAVYKDNDGNVLYTTENAFDANGNMTTCVVKDVDGNISYTQKFEYDANGNMVKRTTLDTEGKIVETTDMAPVRVEEPEVSRRPVEETPEQPVTRPTEDAEVVSTTQEQPRVTNEEPVVRPVNENPVNSNVRSEFNEAFENSKIFKTTKNQHSIDSLGGRKLQEYSAELDDLCKKAVTADELDLLEQQIKKFRGGNDQAEFMSRINARRQQLAEGNIRSINDEVKNIPDTEIPQAQRANWTKTKQDLQQILNELRYSVKIEATDFLERCKNLSARLKTIAKNASVAVKAQIKNILKNLKELLRNKGVIKPKTTETPVQQHSFDDMFENSQLARTTNGKPGTTVDRLGGEKFARISQEVDDLCASATTLDQLQVLENRVKMFRSEPQRNALLNKIEAQKIVLVENALKTNPLGVQYDLASFTPVEKQLICQVHESVQKSLTTGKSYGFPEGSLQKLYETGNLTEKGICAIFDIGGRNCISVSDYNFFCQNKIKLTSIDSDFIINERYYTVTNKVLLPDSPSFKAQAPAILDAQRRIMANIPKEGKVVIVSGHPASGKSTATSQVVNPENYLNVDPDAYKASFVEYNHGLGTDIVHKASGEIRDILISEAVSQRTNLVIETTGNATKVQRLIDTFQQQGYEVEIIHINRDPSVCAQGLVTRADKTGRVVPPEILIDDAVKCDYTTIPGIIKSNNPDITVTTFTNEGTLDNFINSRKIL